MRERERDREREENKLSEEVHRDIDYDRVINKRKRTIKCRETSHRKSPGDSERNIYGDGTSREIYIYISI